MPDALLVRLKVVRDHFGDRKAVSCVANCRRQNFLHLQPPISLVQLKPAVNSTRYADRQWAVRRDSVDSTLLEILERHRLRRATGCIQARQFLLFCIPHDGEQVAANATACRLHQTQHRVRGDRRIDRTTAGLQNIERDLCCQRLTGGRHRMRGDDFGARCMGATCYSVITRDQMPPQP